MSQRRVLRFGVGVLNRMSYQGRPDTLTPQLSDEQVNSMLLQPSPAMSAPSDSPYRSNGQANGSTPLLGQPHLMPTFAKLNNALDQSNNSGVGQQQEGYQSIGDQRRGSDVMEEETEDCCPLCSIA